MNTSPFWPATSITRPSASDAAFSGLMRYWSTTFCISATRPESSARELETVSIWPWRSATSLR